MSNIKKLIGEDTINNVVQGEEKITFYMNSGREIIFYHQQSCCESVWVEDVNGNWEDLYNTPIIVAECRTEHNNDVDWGTQTWTFYTFRTIKGSVDVRWCGESNGYYSEEVDIKWKDENGKWNNPYY